jgi:hypothetical protein
MSLGIVIPYCSNEEDLIDDVLARAKDVSTNIVVVAMTHFFGGDEDVKVIPKLRSLEKEGIIAKVIPWKHIPGAPQNFWIKALRLHGFQHLKPCDWVLFIDSDEVIRNPPQFLNWFHSVKDNLDTSYKLSCYWYFLSKQRRSKVIEDSVVLVSKKVLHIDNFRLTNSERENLASASPIQLTQVRGLEGEVMFDHFSWVRTRDVMVKKVMNWSHREDRDWVSLVNQAFDSDLLTTPDFVHGYDYDILER